MNDLTTPDASVLETSLVRLRSLPNYRVAAGDPDVRGWEVLGSDGRKIGEVDDLLVDRQQLRARYLDVRLDPALVDEQSEAAAETVSVGQESEPATALETPDLPPGDLVGLGAAMEETVVRATLSDEENRLTQEHHLGFHGRHVLIPIGRARLEAEHDRISIDGLRSADVLRLPDYNGQDLDREYEASLRGWFDAAYSPAPEQDFYAHHLYDEERFYGPRRGPAREDAAAPQEEAVLAGRGRE